MSCKTIFDFFESLNRLERTYELSILLVGEKFCCRVMECTIKVIHFRHRLPATRGNHGANGTKEIMAHWPARIHNTGVLHKYALFLSQRIRLWTNKTNAKAQDSSVSEHILRNKAMMEMCVIFGKLFSAPHKWFTFPFHLQILNFSLSSYSIDAKAFCLTANKASVLCSRGDSLCSCLSNRWHMLYLTELLPRGDTYSPRITKQFS